MDARTEVVVDMGPYVWTPELRPDGTVEIYCVYFDDTVGHFVSGSVSPEKYLEFWDAKLLKFQQTNTPRPEGYPSDKEVQKFLDGKLKAIARQPSKFEVEEEITQIPKPREATMTDTDLSTPGPEQESTLPAHEDSIKSEVSTNRRGLPPERFRALMAEARAAGKARTSFLENFPPVNETAATYAKLSEAQRVLLKESLTKQWGRRKRELAQECGVTVVSVTKRLSQALQALGLDRQPKRKKYLKRVIAYFEKHQEELLPKGAPVEATEMPVAEPSPTQVNGQKGGHQIVVPLESDRSTSAASVVQDSNGVLLIRRPPDAKEVSITFKF